jgi:hypothetical protein
MTTTIWKYEFKKPRETFEMPDGATPLCVDMQTYPCLWALVSPDADKLERTFELIATGEEIQLRHSMYIGTVMMPSAFAVSLMGVPNLVWHIFEDLDSKEDRTERERAKAENRNPEYMVIT